LVCVVYSDEDTSVEALVMRWLQNQDEDDRDVLGGWIKDYFYDALKWILEQVATLSDVNHIYCHLLVSIRGVCLLLDSSARYLLVSDVNIHRVPKLAITLASNAPNSVCSSWISTKYRTLHYLTIIYHRTYYDRTLPCVLSLTSL